MALIVQKYGGKTLESPEKIKLIAQRVKALSRENLIIIVVSAMGKTTDDLIALSREITKKPNQREFDMLITAGERISMSLLTMALNDIGCPAISFTGSQAGILTNGVHGDANIQELKPIRIEEALHKNLVVVVAGFQGVNPSTKEVQTLGRGGSDTTAVAFASHFKAERCEIRKEFAGVFECDPKLLETARPLTQATYDMLCALSKGGAKFIHHKAAAMAKDLSVPLYIGSAEKADLGTEVVRESEASDSKNIVAHFHTEENRHSLTLASTKSLDDEALTGTLDLLMEFEIEVLESDIGKNSICFSLTAPPSEETKANFLKTLFANN